MPAGRSGTSPGMALNAIELQSYLTGLDYPVSKEDLVRWAEETGASTGTIQLLRSLPIEVIQSPAEVDDAIGELS